VYKFFMDTLQSIQIIVDYYKYNSYDIRYTYLNLPKRNINIKFCIASNCSKIFTHNINVIKFNMSTLNVC